MENKENIRLVELAISGDVSAFEQLYKDKSLMMLYFAYNILGDYHEAQDAAQEAVVLMCKNINKLKDPARFDAWLHKIVKNVCNEIMRKKLRRDEQIKEDDFFAAVADDDIDTLPKDFLENEEMKRTLMDAINKLPKMRKMTLSMYYFENMSYEEIAYTLNSSVPTVGTNIMRGKKQLKDILEKDNKIDLAQYKSFAIAPILGEAFKFDATTTFTPELVTSFQASCSNALTGVTAVKASIGAKIFSILKIGGTAAACTGIIVGGILYMNMDEPTKEPPPPVEKKVVEQTVQETPVEKSTPEEDPKLLSKGQIKFNNSDCDCGHVNPDSVVVENVDAGVEIKKWEITDSSRKKIYDGKGSSVGNVINKMYKDKKDGRYTIKFYLEHSERGKIQLTRDFRIDTGIIKEDQYD